MANKHETLTSLFTDIADSIRVVKEENGTTYIADNFPDAILKLGSSTAVQWDSKMDKILSPVSNGVTSIPLEIKALIYYDGYWYGAGTLLKSYTSSNNGAYTMGDLCLIYGKSLSSMSHRLFTRNRPYPINNMTCDGTHILMSIASGGYDNSAGVIIPVSVFRNDNNHSNKYSCTHGDSNYSFYDVVSTQPSTYVYYLGKYQTHPCITSFLYGGAENTYSKINSTTNLSSCWISGCADKNFNPVAVSNDGYISLWATNGTVIAKAANQTYKQYSELNGATKIRTMNNYICIASVKDNGTYLSYTNGNPITDGLSTFKITNDKLNIIDMIYINGIYTVIGNDSNNIPKVWQSTNLNDHGIYGRSINIASSGYTIKAIATNGTQIGIYADNNSTAIQELTITM